MRSSRTTWLAILALTPSFPVAAAPSRAQNAPAKATATVYLDVSGTMAGYVRQQSGETPIGDLLTLLTNRVGIPGDGAPAWRCFGDRIAQINGDVAVYSRPAPYSTPTSSPCGNQTSRIDAVLTEVRQMPPSALALIVSDLWLDGSQMAANPSVALGVPLKAMLEEGRATAILGVNAPFAGRITGVPSLGGGSYDKATRRPLFIVAIGPEQAVARLVTSLRDSGVPAFADQRLKVALFRGRGRPLPLAVPAAKGGGFAGSGANLRIEKSLAERQGGRIERMHGGEERLLRGTVWDGPPAAIAIVETRTNGTWQALPKTLPLWSIAKGDGQRLFRLDAKSVSALPPGDYRLTALLGTKGLQRPNAAASWLREWSMGMTEPPQPGFVKALQLSVLADILEAADDGLARRVPYKQGSISVELPFRPNQQFRFNLQVKQ